MAFIKEPSEHEFYRICEKNECCGHSKPYIKLIYDLDMFKIHIGTQGQCVDIGVIICLALVPRSKVFSKEKERE